MPFDEDRRHVDLVVVARARSILARALIDADEIDRKKLPEQLAAALQHVRNACRDAMQIAYLETQAEAKHAREADQIL